MTVCSLSQDAPEAVGLKCTKPEVSIVRSTLNGGGVTYQANCSELKFRRIMIMHVID